MELQKLFLNILKEQQQQPLPNNDLETFDDNDDEPRLPQQPDTNQGDDDLQQLGGYNSPYKSNEYLSIKKKWKTEVPHLSEQEMDNDITVFNGKKNNLIPFREDFTDEGVPSRGMPNQPEINSLKLVYPDFPSENVQKLRDINSYTWAQFDFFTQRFVTEDMTNEMSVYGDTDKLSQFEGQIQLWKSDIPTKIFDNNGLVVHKIRNKTDAVMLGKLSKMMYNKHGGISMWCITQDSPSSTFYKKYRQPPFERSYYFVLRTGDIGTDKESDPYCLSVLQPSKSNDGPFIITDRRDEDTKRLSWSDVLRYYPQLQGSENLFHYTPLTNEEKNEILLDQITFTDKNSPNYFITLPPHIQDKFITSGKNIPSLDAIKILTKERLNSYINGTTLDNYLNRYVSNDKQNSFEIFNFLEKDRPFYYRALDRILIGKFNISEGIQAIKNSILIKEFKLQYIDQNNKDIRLVINENVKNVGVYDYVNKKFILDPVYVEKGRYIFYNTVKVKNSNMTKKVGFLVIKYDVSHSFYESYQNSQNTNQQTFYVVYKVDNAYIKTEDKYNAQFIFDAAKGEALWRAVKTQLGNE